jgi:hypothetical protein
MSRYLVTHRVQFRRKLKILKILSYSKNYLKKDLTKGCMETLYKLSIRIPADESRDILKYLLDNQVNNYVDSFGFMYLLYISN